VSICVKQLYWIRKLQVLSIDVVLGALSGGVLAVKSLNVQMGVAWWIVLAVAVWIVYTTDHLIDSNKLGNTASGERRLFYYENSRIILVTTIVLVVVVLFISFLLLDNKIVWFGLSMGIFVAIYLLLIQIKGSKKTIWLQKELIVAIVYSTGIWAGPILCSLNIIGFYEIILIASFFLIVWADILFIAQCEIENDKRDGFTSLPVIIGEKNTVKLISLILSVSGLSLLFLIFSQNTDLRIIISAIILLIMSFVLHISLRNKNVLLKRERYRVLAEGIFFLPALIVFVV